MAFVQPPNSFDGPGRSRRIETRPPRRFGDMLVELSQLLLIFVMLRVAMLVSGLTFFYVPVIDEGLQKVISYSRGYFDH